MKFLVHCKTPEKGEGVTDVMLYDNITNEIFVRSADGGFVRADFNLVVDGVPLAKEERHQGETKTEKKAVPVTPLVSPRHPIIGKSNSVRKLRIQLGLACNYHCSYCMQSAVNAPRRFSSLSDSEMNEVTKEIDSPVENGEQRYRPGEKSHFSQTEHAPKEKSGRVISINPIVPVASSGSSVAEGRRPPRRKTPEERAEAFLCHLQNAGIAFEAVTTPEGVRKAPVIEFWGGEPLVYRKVLLPLIEKLRERYGDAPEDPGVPEMRLITNGSLLTDELVDFLVERRVQVAISHDGPGFALRNDKDPLTDPKMKAVWLRLLEKSREAGIPMCFHSVITPKNADLEALQTFFQEQFSKDVNVTLEGIVSDVGSSVGEEVDKGEDARSKDNEDTEGNEDRGCVFSVAEAEVLQRSVLKLLTQAPESRCEDVAGIREALEDVAMPFMRKLIERIPATSFAMKCDVGAQKSLTVDLDGNVGACHNRALTDDRIGTLEDLGGVVNDKLTSWRLRPACADCFALSLCKAGCPHSTDEELARGCRNEQLFHAAVFAAVWEKVTGRRVCGIEACVPKNTPAVNERK